MFKSFMAFLSMVFLLCNTSYANEPESTVQLAGGVQEVNLAVNDDGSEKGKKKKKAVKKSKKSKKSTTDR